MDNDPNYAYYGCQILLDKIKISFGELPKSEWEGLRNSLFELCKRFKNGIIIIFFQVLQIVELQFVMQYHVVQCKWMIGLIQ